MESSPPHCRVGHGDFVFKPDFFLVFSAFGVFRACFPPFSGAVCRHRINADCPVRFYQQPRCGGHVRRGVRLGSVYGGIGGIVSKRRCALISLGRSRAGDGADLLLHFPHGTFRGCATLAPKICFHFMSHLVRLDKPVRTPAFVSGNLIRPPSPSPVYIRRSSTLTPGYLVLSKLKWPFAKVLFGVSLVIWKV